MKPRDFLNFFKTKSGKLIAFGVIFAAGLIIFSTIRQRHTAPNAATTPLGTNSISNQPEVVQTVVRPLQVFNPPPPPNPTSLPPLSSPSMPGLPVQAFTNTPVRALAVVPPRQSESLSPISLFADSTAGTPRPRKLSAEYRILAEKDPVKWQKAKCHILPEKTKATLISSLLSQYHLKGKKEWKPFEQAGFLYRRFYKEKVSLPELVEESGLSKSKVEHLIETYKFMFDNKDTHLQRWSYYDVYLKPKKIKKMREEYPTFDTVVVQMIKNGEFNEARDVRDKLPLICDGPKKNLEKFLDGKIDFAAAVSHVAENKDGINGQKHLNKFRAWIAQPKRLDALTASNGEIRKKVLFEVRSIHDCLTKLRAKLEKPS